MKVATKSSICVLHKHLLVFVILFSSYLLSYQFLVVTAVAVVIHVSFVEKFLCTFLTGKIITLFIGHNSSTAVTKSYHFLGTYMLNLSGARYSYIHL